MTRMNARTCPNCGAPVSGTVCQYCGSADERIFELEPGTPVMISYKLKGKRITFQLSIRSLSVSADTTDIYSNGSVYASWNNGYDVSLSGRLVPFEHDSLSAEKIFWIEEEA